MSKVKVYQDDNYVCEIDDADDEIVINLPKPLHDGRLHFEPALNKRAASRIVFRSSVMLEHPLNDAKVRLGD
jgi:hypothetical protein